MKTEPHEAPPATEAAPRANGMLSVALVAVIAFGFVTSLLNPALLRSPDGALHDGSWTSAYEEAFRSELGLLPASSVIWNALDLALFGQGPAGVIVGEGGWLFTTEEYASPADWRSALEAWSAEIARVSAELEARGAALLVVPVPAKAASVPHLAPPLPRAAGERYEALLERLGEAGVPTADLRSVLASESAWLRTDTHWTPHGADLTAQLISGRMHELVPTLPASLSYEMVAEEPTEFRGDLNRLLALGPFESALAPPPDRLTVGTVAAANGPAGSLFDDAGADVVLVGTSYSAASEWGLADRLRLHAGVDLLDLSVSGRGPMAPMLEYLRSDTLGRSAPSLVVWEVPVRYLTDTTYLTGGDPNR